MGINSTEVAYGFGQMGSGFVDDTGAFTPPTGKVIVAVQFISDSTITTLTAVNDGDEAYFGTGTQTANNGANSEAIDSGNTFPAGVTVFGRYSALTLATGSAIVYFGH
jgi:hypothetical protein